VRYLMNISVVCGLLQGFLIVLNMELWNTSQARMATLLALDFAFIFALLVVQLTPSGKAEDDSYYLNTPQWLLTATFSVTFGALTYYIMGSCHSSNNGSTAWAAGWWVVSIAVAYIALPFIQSWPQRYSDSKHARSFGFDYPSLFTHGWDNILLILFSGLFMSMYWLLIVLWVELFNILNISIFEDIFFNKWFSGISLGVAFGVGLFVGHQHRRIVSALQHIILTMCFVLMPLTALITILFSVSLPFTGLSGIWSTGYSTPILLFLIAANIFFVNGVFGNGEPKHPDSENEPETYPKALRIVVSISLVVLNALSAIAVYSVYLRVEQYGWTPARVYLAIAVLIACFYALSYFWVVFKSKQWLMLLPRFNVINAILVMAVLLLFNLPFFNPLSISAADQFERLRAGKVSADEFDYGVLKYKLGQPGLDYLERLRVLTEHKELSIIKGRLALLDSSTSQWEWETSLRDEIRGRIQFNWKGEVLIEDELLETLLKPLKCNNNICKLYLLDLDVDGTDEVIVLNTHRWRTPQVLGLVNDKWQVIGRINCYGNQNCTKSSFLDSFEQESFKILEPKYQNLFINGMSLKLNEEI